MKKQYQSPEMNLQNFAPNENVAACYLVQCPVHLNPQTYGEYKHSGRGQWHEVSRADMLAAGATEAQLAAVDADPNHTAKSGHTLTIDLGGDGVMRHTDVQVCWDYDGTNFGS